MEHNTPVTDPIDQDWYERKKEVKVDLPVFHLSPEDAREGDQLQADLLKHQKELKDEASRENIAAFHPLLDQPLTEEQRNARWENTHYIILQTIKEFMDEFGYMPNKTDIATRAGISRKSVHHHLKSYHQSQVFRNLLDQYKFIAPVIIDKLIDRSLKGDSRAAKVFLDSMHKIRSWQPLKAQQEQNALQVGELKLTQEMIDRLNAAELKEFTDFCKRLKLAVFENQ